MLVVSLAQPRWHGGGGPLNLRKTVEKLNLNYSEGVSRIIGTESTCQEHPDDVSPCFYFTEKCRCVPSTISESWPRHWVVLVLEP